MKKTLSFLGICVVLLLACTFWFSSNFALVNGTPYSLDTTDLNLSGDQLKRPETIARLSQLETADLRNTGLTPEDYEMLRNTLPDCEILWLVPFQGAYLDPNSTSLTISSITYCTPGTLVSIKNCSSSSLRRR